MTYEAEETIWNIKDWRLIYKLELLPNCRRWQSWWYYTTHGHNGMKKKTLKWAASETWWSFGEGMKTKEQRHWNKKICGLDDLDSMREEGKKDSKRDISCWRKWEEKENWPPIEPKSAKNCERNTLLILSLFPQLTPKSN